jgi:hypothetical protein
LLRANAEGVLDITGADFPSSGGDLVTALAKERRFLFLGVKKKSRHACRPRAMQTLGFLCCCPSWLW